MRRLPSPRTDWEVIPLQLDQLNHLKPMNESQPYPRHIQAGKTVTNSSINYASSFQTEGILE